MDLSSVGVYLAGLGTAAGVWAMGYLKYKREANAVNAEEERTTVEAWREYCGKLEGKIESLEKRMDSMSALHTTEMTAVREAHAKCERENAELKTALRFTEKALSERIAALEGTTERRGTRQEAAPAPSINLTVEAPSAPTS